MREARFFFNGVSRRSEVALERFIKHDGGFFWTVSEDGGENPPGVYNDTDEDYAAALADYEARVAERMALM